MFVSFLDWLLHKSPAAQDAWRHVTSPALSMKKKTHPLHCFTKQDGPHFITSSIHTRNINLKQHSSSSKDRLCPPPRDIAVQTWQLQCACGPGSSLWCMVGYVLGPTASLHTHSGSECLQDPNRWILPPPPPAPGLGLIKKVNVITVASSDSPPPHQCCVHIRWGS